MIEIAVVGAHLTGLPLIGCPRRRVVKVMCIAIHPYITGAPHRITALEAPFADLAADPRIAFLQGDEIADWYLASTDPA